MTAKKDADKLRLVTVASESLARAQRSEQALAAEREKHAETKSQMSQEQLVAAAARSKSAGLTEKLAAANERALLWESKWNEREMAIEKAEAKVERITAAYKEWADDDGDDVEALLEVGRSLGLPEPE